MSTVRTPWHVYFAMFVQEIAPPDIRLQFEVIFTTEPQRGDILLLRRGDAGHRDGEAKSFRGLWARIRTHTLMEYKSLAWPLRPGDLARLQGYGAQYFAAQAQQGPFLLEELSLVLVVPTRTPTLEDEVKRMGWTMTSLGEGYARIVGSGYAMMLVVIKEVSQAEQDELLGLFSRRKWTRKQIRWLWKHHAGSLEGVNVQDVEGYDEVIEDMLASMPPEKLVKGLAPEERVKGLPPEERVKGLPPEQLLLALPIDMLRGLSEEYVRSLPAHVSAAIRARISESIDH